MVRAHIIFHLAFFLAAAVQANDELKAQGLTPEEIRSACESALSLNPAREKEESVIASDSETRWLFETTTPVQARTRARATLQMKSHPSNAEAVRDLQMAAFRDYVVDANASQGRRLETVQTLLDVAATVDDLVFAQITLWFLKENKQEDARAAIHQVQSCLVSEAACQKHVRMRYQYLAWTLGRAWSLESGSTQQAYFLLERSLTPRLRELLSRSPTNVAEVMRQRGIQMAEEIITNSAPNSIKIEHKPVDKKVESVTIQTRSSGAQKAPVEFRHLQSVPFIGDRQNPQRGDGQKSIARYLSFARANAFYFLSEMKPKFKAQNFADPNVQTETGYAVFSWMGWAKSLTPRLRDSRHKEAGDNWLLQILNQATLLARAEMSSDLKAYATAIGPVLRAHRVDAKISRDGVFDLSHLKWMAKYSLKEEHGDLGELALIKNSVHIIRYLNYAALFMAIAEQSALESREEDFAIYAARYLKSTGAADFLSGFYDLHSPVFARALDQIRNQDGL